MEESREIRKLFNFLQGAVYGTIVLEVLVFSVSGKISGLPEALLLKIGNIRLYNDMLYSKLFTLALMLAVSVGTRPKKSIQLKPFRQITMPLFAGLLLFFGSIFLYQMQMPGKVISIFTTPDVAYMVASLAGAIMLHVGLDNISKHIQSGWMKDRFNVENESFEQSKTKDSNPYSVNLPMHYYFNKRMHKGWLNITNPFRGNLLMGTPGSGKTYSIIMPFIRQHLAKGFTMVVYDFKYPDLTHVAYHHYLKHQHKRKKPVLKFHVLNLNQLEKSRRINPLKSCYIPSLAAALETAEAMIEALRKSDKSHGADQFFSQSAINFLAAIIYYFSKIQNGTYSTLAHVLAFINHSYEEIFNTLYQEKELHSLLAPFRSAYEKKAFDQLEGQIGTLRVNLARLATKETFWLFSGDDFPLDISHPNHPAVLVIANDPQSQQINSAVYSVVINRLFRLLNQKGNLPCSVIIDEVPTLYIHKIENLLATARSNKVSILLGLQELPQFRQQYGRETAETICSIPANILSGAVRHRDTLLWLEKLFGRIRQVRNGLSIDRNRTTVSLNEYLDNLIPASKIAHLKAGELVAQVAASHGKGKYEHHMYHCRIAIDASKIKKEEHQYLDAPDCYDFGGDKDAILTANMERIKREVANVVVE